MKSAIASLLVLVLMTGIVFSETDQTAFPTKTQNSKIEISSSDTYQERTYVPRIYEGEIKGVITDKENRPLPGASITLFSAKGEEYNTITDVDGHFDIKCLPSGLYKFHAEMAAFSSSEIENIQLNDKKVIDLGTIVMKYGFFDRLDFIQCYLIMDLSSFDPLFGVHNNFSKTLPLQRTFTSMLSIYPSVSCNR